MLQRKERNIAAIQDPPELKKEQPNGCFHENAGQRFYYGLIDLKITICVQPFIDKTFKCFVPLHRPIYPTAFGNRFTIRTCKGNRTNHRSGT